MAKSDPCLRVVRPLPHLVAPKPGRGLDKLPGFWPTGCVIIQWLGYRIPRVHTVPYTRYTRQRACALRKSHPIHLLIISTRLAKQENESKMTHLVRTNEH